MKDIKNEIKVPKLRTHKKNTRFSIDSDILKGIKFSFGIFIFFSILTLITYAGSHYASNILGGTFLGNYTFNGSVEFKNGINLNGTKITPIKEKTIYLNSSMNADEIQSIIDNQSKYIIPNGDLIFQFLDGEYKLNHSLDFKGFYGGGELYLYGNMSESTQLHTNQTVFLNFTNVDDSGINIDNVGIRTKAYNFKIYSNPSYWKIILSVNSNFQISGSYLFGGNSSYSVGINCNYNFCYVSNTYFSSLERGLSSTTGGNLYSSNNDDFGTKPRYALVTYMGGLITKNSIQPEGSESNESIWAGGEIR